MPRRVGYLLRWCSMVWTARRRPKPAAWTVRPCGTGCILQRRGTGRASQSQIAGSWIKTHGAAASRIGRACRCGSRPRGARCRTLAAGDLRDELQRRFGVALHERSVGKVLAKLGYHKLSVRPRHPRADEEAQETFKKTSPRPSRRDSRPRQRQADRNLVPG